MNDGTYALCDSDGELLKRNVDISMLKIITSPGSAPDQQPEPAWRFERVLDARGSPGEREYLIRWSGEYSDPQYDSWEPASSFVDLAQVQKFEKDLAKSKRPSPRQQERLSQPRTTRRKTHRMRSERGQPRIADDSNESLQPTSKM